MASVMPRQSRIDLTGALYHIIARGIERRKLFDEDQDRYDFLKHLGLILEQSSEVRRRELKELNIKHCPRCRKPCNANVEICQCVGTWGYVLQNIN